MNLTEEWQTLLQIKQRTNLGSSEIIDVLLSGVKDGSVETLPGCWSISGRRYRKTQLTEETL